MMRAVELQLLQAEVHVGNEDYASAEASLNSLRTSAGVAEYSGQMLPMPLIVFYMRNVIPYFLKVIGLLI